MNRDVKKEFKLFCNEAKSNFRSIKNLESFKKQIPNFLTLLRLIILPFILVNIAVGNLLIGGLLAIFSVSTDLFDGMIARRLNASTKFGEKFDSLSDKLFSLTILIALAFVNIYVLIPVVLDIVIGATNSYFLILGGPVKTSFLGKVKTLFLDILLCSLFFTNIEIIAAYIMPLILCVVLLQLFTLYYYLEKYLEKKN